MNDLFYRAFEGRHRGSREMSKLRLGAPSLLLSVCHMPLDCHIEDVAGDNMMSNQNPLVVLG